MSHSSKVWKALLVVWFTFLYISTSYIIMVQYVRGDPWSFADWLISYKEGFVRRGLTGELVFFISSHSPLNPGQVVVIIVLSLYFIFYLLSFILLKNEHDPFPYILLVFSPFIFSFQVNDSLALAAGKKEILFFILLLTNVLAARKGKRTFLKALFSSLGIFPLITLSHEGLVIYLPYLLMIYILLYGKEWKEPRKLVIIISLLIANLIVFYLVYKTVPMEKSKVSKLMRYVINSGYKNFNIPMQYITGGAFDWLSRTREVAREYVNRLLNNYIKFYPQAILLAFIGYIPLLKKLKVIFKNPLNFLLLSTTLFGTYFLLLYAIDWGRFIQIHLFSIFALTFVVKEPVQIPKKWKILILFLLPIYALFWYIPVNRNAYPYNFINYLRTGRYITDFLNKVKTVFFH